MFYAVITPKRQLGDIAYGSVISLGNDMDEVQRLAESLNAVTVEVPREELDVALWSLQNGTEIWWGLATPMDRAKCN